MLEFLISKTVVTFQFFVHVVYIYICSKVFIYYHSKWLFYFSFCQSNSLYFLVTNQKCGTLLNEANENSMSCSVRSAVFNLFIWPEIDWLIIILLTANFPR